MSFVAGVGVDIVRIERFRQFLNEGKSGVLDRLFTSSEMNYAMKKRDPAPHLAARFAAKEAFLKALGTGLRNGISWKGIHVVKDELGKPMLELTGKTFEIFEEAGGGSLHLSLSHDGDYTIATVILERER